MSVSTSVPIKCNHWHSLKFQVSASGVVALDVKSTMTGKANIEIANNGQTEFDIATLFNVSVKAPVRIAARFFDPPCCFNGKIEAP